MPGPAMIMFDATIDLVPGLTRGRSLSAGEVATVRSAVEAIDGAGWIDVEENRSAPDVCDWLVLHGRHGPFRDGSEQRKLRQEIEHAVRMSLASTAGKSMPTARS